MSRRSARATTGLLATAALALTPLAAASAHPGPDPDRPGVTTTAARGETSGCGFPGCAAQGTRIRVMTRNIYLGADLTPAFAAPDAAGFVSANGGILRQVGRTKMPTRAKGLAAEIQRLRPDLVGLQEAALWRVGSVDFAAALNGQPVATTVYQDFIDLLLTRVNRGPTKYRVALVKKEFDFEAPADSDGDPATGLLGADQNGRLTMRDAILVRRGAGIKVKAMRTGTYRDLMHVNVAGTVDVAVTRGWLSMMVKVRDSPWIRFSNTHLEAFDDRTERPSIRALQAREFAAKVHRGNQPDIALGDFNSDSPGLVPGDEQAFVVMKRNGFRDIGTRDPLGCCISDPNLRGGSRADFDHRVDQILTTTPDRVFRVRSWVTGRSRHNGLWNSDHAGVTSELLVFRTPPVAGRG